MRKGRVPEMAQLSYQIPDRGRPRRVLRVPESHTLYLCPNACGRRQGLRALRNGVADHVSFLRFSQADVVLGDYLEQVEDAVATLLATVRPRPQVLSLYVNCIDDFLGTDGESLLAGLRTRFPETRFLLSHINPIAADVQSSTAQRIHANLYTLLEPRAHKDAGVNLVGGFEPLAADCELYDVLRGAQAGPIRQIVTSVSYGDYARMASSMLTLSLSHLGDAAASDMESRLGIPSFRWPASYDLDEIERRYEELALALRSNPVDCAGYRARAEQVVAWAREAVGDLPIAVDSSSSMMPFSLALALRAYGFNVRAVFGLHLKGCDDEAEARLMAECPEIMVVRRESYEALCGYGMGERWVAVGSDAGFLLHARHLADLYHDEGCFGFHGVERLMMELAAAVGRTQEWII